MTKRTVVSVIMASLIAGVCLGGCEKGTMQKAGKKVDEATGQDKLIGKGPAEKTGRKIDNNVNDLKK
jgi:hypothetical protein